MGRNLLQRIEAFLKEADMPPSVFGRHVAKDPRLVSDMRGGREVGRRLALQIEHFMNIWREQWEAGRIERLGDLRTREARNPVGIRASAPGSVADASSAQGAPR